jgi:CHASE2 domain-containing sensor protein
VAVAITLLVWLLDFSAAFQALDDMGYDACLRLTCGAPTDPAHVLLVYADREHLAGGSDGLESLARALLKLGARKIGFTCALSEPSAGLVRLAKQTGNIVLAQEFHPHPVDPDKLESSPVAAAVVNLPRGLVGLSPGSDGVYRSHFGSLLVDGFRQSSLEATLAREVLLDDEAVPAGGFRVAFRGASGSCRRQR